MSRTFAAVFEKRTRLLLRMPPCVLIRLRHSLLETHLVQCMFEDVLPILNAAVGNGSLMSRNGLAFAELVL